MRPTAMIVLLLWLGALLPPQFSAGVDLVEIYATVTSAGGRPVTDLAREHFIVFDEGSARRVVAFAAGQDLPLSVALAFDRSWSMAGDRLDTAKLAAHRFFDELRTEDEAMLITVSSAVETAVPLTRDRAALKAAVDGLTSWGTTALHDAIVDALGRIEMARGRKALVILSDGKDRYSAHNAEAVMERARRSDVLVYPVSLGSDESELFTGLADLTGGRTYRAGDADDLPEVFKAIVGELRRQYLLGFEPAGRQAGPPGWHPVKVLVTRPAGAKVRARSGYFR